MQEEVISALKDRMETARQGILNLKSHREQYIALLNKVNTEISDIDNDIIINEQQLENLNDELKQIEVAIKKEEET